jgi:methyl-accepting chemotaxis protein
MTKDEIIQKFTDFSNRIADLHAKGKIIRKGSDDVDEKMRQLDQIIVQQARLLEEQEEFMREVGKSYLGTNSVP